jgi:hypothetical protein
MKTKIATLILSLSAALLSLGAEVKQALAVEMPPGWELKYNGEKGLQFYTLTRKEGDTALLMFSRWPAAGNSAQIPELMETLAEGFLAQAKKSDAFKLESTEYKIEEIKGGPLSGQYVKFSIRGGIVQNMFMVGDNEGIWNGQFTGTAERWADALAILKKLKNND